MTDAYNIEILGGPGLIVVTTKQIVSLIRRTIVRGQSDGIDLNIVCQKAIDNLLESIAEAKGVKEQEGYELFMKQVRDDVSAAIEEFKLTIDYGPPYAVIIVLAEVPFSPEHN